MKLNENIKKNIGAKIKARRTSKGLTQNAVAIDVGMDEKQLSRLEAGKHYPTIKTLLAIIDVLGMKLADFDDIEVSYSADFYTIVEILKSSKPKELKRYLSVIKALKDFEV